jgi:CRP-like cAMP-binding protein
MEAFAKSRKRVILVSVTPLPDSVSVLLRSNATAAIAALLLISVAHRELYAWASQAIYGAEPPKPNGYENVAKHSPPVRNRLNGTASYSERRRSDRDAADASLVDAMRDAPGASIVDLAAAIGRSRSSIVSALGRLKSAGLVANEGRVWALLEEPAPKVSSPRWAKALSGAEKAHQVHLTAS